METVAAGKRNGQRGFTLIELLIVCVVLGIVAAIAISNLLAALDKSKQKRTMMELRSISSAVETYNIDRGRYPAGVAIDGLEGVITPNYLKDMPTKDAWSHLLVYSEGTPAGKGYTIGSGGKNGGALTAVGIGGPTNSYDDAIIIVNGSFVQWPEGIQRN